MGPQEEVIALALCFLAAAPPGTQAEADFKDCHNISTLVTEGDKVVVQLNTSKEMEVDKWNSINSIWESVLLISNGKSRLLNSKFTDQFAVYQENFTVMNVSKAAQGVYRVRLTASWKCVALFNLTVQAPTAPPSVIPGNQAPAAHPAWWALFPIPIIVAIVIYLAVQRCCPRKDGSRACVYTQPSGEEEGIQIRTEECKNQG